MNFNVLEEFICGKSISQSLCEDKIFYNSNFAAVIDGVTSKSKLFVDHKSPGLNVCEIIVRILKEIPFNYSCEKTIEAVSSKIYSEYKKQKIEKHMYDNPVDRFTASAIIYSKYFSQIWMVGDCQCILNGRRYKNTKKVDRILSDVRSFFIKSEILNGASEQDFIKHDIGREYIMPFLKRQGIFQNNYNGGDLAYPVFDGFPININHVKTIDVSEGYCVFASDGYPRIYSTLERSEEYLRYILQHDPLCYKKFKSTKGVQDKFQSFDDRAYLKFEINNV